MKPMVLIEFVDALEGFTKPNEELLPTETSTKEAKSQQTIDDLLDEASLERMMDFMKSLKDYPDLENAFKDLNDHFQEMRQSLSARKDDKDQDIGSMRTDTETTASFQDKISSAFENLKVLETQPEVGIRNGLALRE
jgi:hypothetical protein